jgi:hypothetical protein
MSSPSLGWYQTSPLGWVERGQWSDGSEITIGRRKIKCMTSHVTKHFSR